MILLADSGSTKTEFKCVGYMKAFSCSGLNPYFMESDQIASEVQKYCLFDPSEVSEVRFYGAGCSGMEMNNVVKTGLQKVFNMAEIYVENDMYAAAKALVGDEPGIVGILGTGSNFGYYDGNKFLYATPSLGYVLGDEGAGTALGKSAVRTYLRNEFSKELMADFELRFKTDPSEILKKIYKEQFPNRYLASFAQWLVENKHHNSVQGAEKNPSDLIDEILEQMIVDHLVPLTAKFKSEINLVGSVAYALKEEINALCLSRNIKLGKILKAPIEGLESYFMLKLS